MSDTQAYDDKRMTAMDRALARIANLGMDCPAAMEPEVFYRDQLQHAIGLAARTRHVWGWSENPLGSEEEL